MSLRPGPTERTGDELLEFGVVVLDKPAGPTAHQISSWVKSLTGVERAGHVGTLDPNVTGCLPILLGSATRLSGVLTEGTKAYVAILEVHDAVPPNWRETIRSFEGRIYQRPPRKSAVARRLRQRTIHELDILERHDRRVLLRVRCDAGTYIRKLCHDLGLALGTGGHMASLRRTAGAPFDDGEVVTLHDLADGLAFWRADDDESALRSVVRPAEAALDELAQVVISANTAAEVANGAPVYAPGVRSVADGLEPSPADPPPVVCTTPDGAAVCLGRYVGDPAETEGTVVALDRVLV